MPRPLISSRASQPARQRAHWTRLRLTRHGWVFVTLAMMVGLAAAKSQVALVFVLFGMMVGALAISVVVAWRMVSAVTVGRDLPDRAWQNQAVHVGYHLRSTRRYMSSLALAVSEVQPVGIESASGYCLHLPARAVFRSGGRFVVRRRGAIRLGALRVSTVFPFGLLRAERLLDAPAELLVWPARGQLKRNILYQGAVETSSAAPSRATGGQDEFFGLREYRPGDNPRWIHWRRSAAKGAPVIREMSRPLPEVLWVVLDTQVHGGEAGLERMLRFAATLVDYALSRGYQVGIALADGGAVRVLAPAEGRAQRSDVLDALARVEPGSAGPLALTLAQLRRGMLRSAQVVVCGSEAGLAAARMGALRSACRHLQVIPLERLPRIFQDDPLCSEVAADAL